MKYFVKRIHKKLSYYKIKFHDKLFPLDVSNYFDVRDYNVETFEDARKKVRNVSQAFCLKDKAMNRLKALGSDYQEESIQEADAVCDHVIKIMGKDYYLGTNINWHKDYVSGFVWPLKFYKDIKIINLLDDSDIKFPWEISRFHHAVVLGKAYYFTGDEKYVREFIVELDSWIINNKPNRGINWNCTMEVAIRLINLTWAYFYFMDCEAISYRFHVRFFNLVLIHAKHIVKNLENKGVVNGNHYLANLLGLIYAGSIFPIFKCSSKLKLFALEEIINEMKCQVYSDGVNFEDSIPYHRLVTEMFLHATCILTAMSKMSNTGESTSNNRNISEEIFGADYIHKLEKMFEFVLFYSKPDSMAPQIGDNDSGRVVYLGKTSKDINNHGHLLSIAGEFFDRDDFRYAGRDSYEGAVWLFNEFKGLEAKESEEISSRGFSESGFYILRSNEDYMIIRCGQIGANGKGSHTHNDNLSFELCAGEISYIVDPGTYTYSRNPEIRNEMRSTKYHNSLVIDGLEHNRFSQKDLFVLYKNSEAKVLEWKTDSHEDMFVGEVDFFVNKGTALQHRRAVRFDKIRKDWHIKDFVYGKSEHVLTWSFHMNVGIKAIEEGDKIILTKNHNDPLFMKINDIDQFNIRVSKGFYSPSYGIKEESDILTLSLKTTLPREFSFSFCKH